MSSNPELSRIIDSEKGSSRRRKFLYLAGAVILLLVAFFIWRSFAAGKGGQITYVTEPIKRGDLRVTVTATAISAVAVMPGRRLRSSLVTASSVV